MNKSYKRVNKKYNRKRKTRKIRRRQYKKRRGGTIMSTCDYDTSKGINWPQNHGCKLKPDGEDPETEIDLEPGTIIDRFGGDSGFYFGDKSSTFDSRSLVSLRPGQECEPEYKKRLAEKKLLYNEYRVLKPFSVKTCTIAPAFGHEGNGVQYRLYENSIIDPDVDATGGDRITPSVKTMLDKGYIEIKSEEPMIPPFDKK